LNIPESKKRKKRKEEKKGPVSELLNISPSSKLNIKRNPIQSSIFSGTISEFGYVKEFGGIKGYLEGLEGLEIGD